MIRSFIQNVLIASRNVQKMEIADRFPCDCHTDRNIAFDLYTRLRERSSTSKDPYRMDCGLDGERYREL